MGDQRVVFFYRLSRTTTQEALEADIRSLGIGSWYTRARGSFAFASLFTGPRALVR